MAVIACLLTGRERAAIATIVLDGPSALEIIAENFTTSSRRMIVPGDIRYGIWHGNRTVSSDAVGESVVVVSEKSKTGEQIRWEVHCHGGEIAANLILDDLSRSGAKVVDQASWLSMTVPDICEREAIEVLSQTSTMRTAAIALGQLRGTIKRFVEASLADLETGGHDSICRTHDRVKAILSFSEFGRHLIQPWSVVLAGLPNVGKSSLINSLVGFRRSITMDEPGTTRDVLHADAVINGWPILLSDTAGIRQDPNGDIERQGIERAATMMKEADLVVWVIDALGPVSINALMPVDPSVRSILVLNKMDLFQGSLDSMGPDVIPVSATKSMGIDELRASIANALIPIVPDPETPVPLTQRQIKSFELIVSIPDKATIRRELERLVGKHG